MNERKEINRLKKENSILYAENQELKYMIHDVQAKMMSCVKILKRNVQQNVVVSSLKEVEPVQHIRT